VRVEMSAAPARPVRLTLGESITPAGREVERMAGVKVCMIDQQTSSIGHCPLTRKYPPGLRFHLGMRVALIDPREEET